jgi:hypothetical protein
LWTNIVYFVSTNCQILYFQYRYKNKNNKTRTVWVSYWRQLNGCFTIFSIAKQNIWLSNCSCLVIVLFCYWKYGKATVQLSPIWHSNCSFLVIVLFCYWKYGKATVQLSPKWLSNCPCLVRYKNKNKNNKTRTVWVSYWRQLNGCFTIFSIAKQNNNKTRTVWESYWRRPFSN